MPKGKDASTAIAIDPFSNPFQDASIARAGAQAAPRATAGGCKLTLKAADGGVIHVSDAVLTPTRQCNQIERAYEWRLERGCSLRPLTTT